MNLCLCLKGVPSQQAVLLHRRNRFHKIAFLNVCSMPKDENLYFIAIIPPSNISAEVTKFREDFAVRFQSKAALRNMPHITLKAPFAFPKANHEQVLHWFEN